MPAVLDPKLRAFFEASQAASLAGLEKFLEIPRISSLPVYAKEVRRAADFVRDELERIGLEHSPVIEGAGHPLVSAEWLRVADKTTLLIYGHHDVRPADPLDEWLSPPFEPTIRGDDIFGRGAADDKGQLWLILKALEALVATRGELPINVRVLIEGEEETNSRVIEDYLVSHGSEIGSTALVGEPEFSLRERLWTRPTLDVHGITGGFTGEKAKTVIPAKAAQYRS